MSCQASIIVVGDGADPLLEQAARHGISRLHELETLWSRFRPDSEISELNRAGGRPLIVSAETVRLVSAMVEGWWLTAGRFDPTMLRPLVEAGYEASRTNSGQQTMVGNDIDLRGRPDEITLDTDRSVVALPVGTSLDPGGIGKGLAADIVIDELLAAGARGALVEVGGDLAVGGLSPTGTSWLIAVREGPLDDASRTVLRLTSGGVATSTTRRRTWFSNSDKRHHHLIDPATMRPSTTGARTCSVVAGSAAMAEAFTKVAFATDPSSALEEFNGRGLGAQIMTDTGQAHTSHAWSRFAVANTQEGRN